jgi:membrane fusion protein (multidrug efflux system)
VQLGEARGDHIEVLKGITEGQTVATAGIFKLSNGAPVTVNNDVMPVFETQSNPADR